MYCIHNVTFSTCLLQEPPGEMPTWTQDANPQQLVATLQLPSGVGAICVLKDPFNNTGGDNFTGC